MRVSRILMLAATIGALTLPALPSHGQTVAPKPPAEAKPAEATKPEQAKRPSSLDELYSRLAAAKDEDEAKGVAGLIERRLERSGSDTADLLYSRAALAMKDRDAALAVELLDRVLQLRPGWSEAWLRRATAFWYLKDPERAQMDLQEALAREPRHFIAWMVLGHLESAAGDKPRALAAYRRALKLHPFLPSVDKAVKRLEPEVDGRDL